MATNQKSQPQQQRSLRRILLKEEFVALTGDYMQALILNYFEQRLHNSEDVDEYLAEENARLQQEGQEAQIPPKEGWQRINAPTLSERTMLDVDERSIRRKLSALTESGYLLDRNNPDQSWDRTKQYRINLHKIRDDLRGLGYELQGWVLTESPANTQTTNLPDASGNMPDRRGTVPDRNSKSASAIQLGSDGLKEKDLPSVGPSEAPAHGGSPADSEAGQTDRLTEGPTDEEPSEKASESSSSVQLLEPEDSHQDEEQAPDLSPKEDEDNATPKPEEKLRQQAESIPAKDVSEEAQSVAREVLGGLPKLFPENHKRDRRRIGRLAEHYVRTGQTNVLRDATDGLARQARKDSIGNPWGYLIACCVDVEKGYSEGDEDLLASLSGENSNHPPEENESASYGWFLGSDDQESDTGEDEHRQHTPNADPEALEVWQKVLDDISEEINAPSLRVWFEGTVPISLSADTLTVSVPNSFAREYIESRFKELLEGALVKHLSPTSVLEIVVDASASTDNTDRRQTP